MNIPEPTDENCIKLAKRVVEDMDLDALIEYAEEGIASFYMSSECTIYDWETDWTLAFGEDE